MLDELGMDWSFRQNRSRDDSSTKLEWSLQSSKKTEGWLLYEWLTKQKQRGRGDRKPELTK